MVKDRASAQVDVLRAASTARNPVLHVTTTCRPCVCVCVCIYIYACCAAGAAPYATHVVATHRASALESCPSQLQRRE